MAEVAALVKSSRLVTVTGPPGIGKTRLAVEVTHQVQGDYPDGAWLVELAPVVHPDLVAQAVASALGLDPEPGRDPADAVVARLSGGDALLVLDNCEHVLAACTALTERLLADCGRLRVVATSQQRLGVAGEQATSLAPLSVPGPGVEALESEAVALFCARAAAGSPSFSPTAENLPFIAEICGRLDGIPLAIELAAARIAALGPADIAERLQDRFRLLTAAGPAAEARHQTLRAAVDWSYELLSSEEATLLRRMSVFAGGATLHAVEEVCTGKGAPRDDAVDLLESLVDRSLVQVDVTAPQPRYRLLETIRAYGHQRLEEAGETEAVRARHGAWCVSLVERSWHRYGVGRRRYWVNDVEADHDNLRAAMEWAIGARSVLAVRLAGALTVFWKTRAYLREGQEWLRRALEAVPDAPGALRARALYGLGLLAILRGEVAVARRAAEECLALAREGRLRRAEAQGLNLLGFLSIFTQDPLGAKPVLEDSVAKARADGDIGSLVGALALLGRAHLFVGDIDSARRVFEECLELAEDGGVETGPALIGLGWAAFSAGELRRSEEFFGRALSLLRDVGDRFDIALVLSFLGRLAWAQGKLDEATILLEEGRAGALVMGAPFPLSACLWGLAEVALAEGDLPTAGGLADEACEVARKAGLPYALVRAQLVRGDVRHADGDVGQARAAYDQALSLARANADSGGVAAALARLARLARLRGASDDAMALLGEAMRLQVESGGGGMVSSLESMAGLAAEGGGATTAARLFGAAQALGEASGSVRTPDEIACYEADVARLRSVLDPVELEAAWVEGAAMPREDAVALALVGTAAWDRPSHGWASLSPAEREVADLVAEGLTNQEIADELSISYDTVRGRLTSVYSKVGVTTRHELRAAQRQRSAGDPSP